MATDDPKENQNEVPETSNSVPEEPTFPVDQFITESLNLDIPTKENDLSDSFPKDD
ncbi:MAG: hypothetical protein WCG82_08175 [Bacteroidota bacterium]